MLVPPHLEKWGYKFFFSLAPLANPVLYPHLKIRVAAHGLTATLSHINCLSGGIYRRIRIVLFNFNYFLSFYFGSAVD